MATGFLLLSDLAMGAPEWEGEEEAFANSLAEDVRATYEPVDAVLIAGGITISGSPDEFRKGSQFLSVLLAGLGSHTVLMVPSEGDLHWHLDPRTYSDWSEVWLPLARSSYPNAEFAFEAPGITIIGPNFWEELNLANSGIRGSGGRANLTAALVPSGCGMSLTETFRSRLDMAFVGAMADASWTLRSEDSLTRITVPRLSPVSRRRGYAVLRFQPNTRPDATRGWIAYRAHLGAEWADGHLASPATHFTIGRARAARSLLAHHVSAAFEPVRIDHVRISQFRSFADFEVRLGHGSNLSGDWTCVAGINGAGKSSLLQGLCIAMLGEAMARELGGERLNRMRRTGKDGPAPRATIEVGLYFPSRPGTATIRAEVSEQGGLKVTGDDLWQRLLPTMVFAAYGATRNLSSRADSSHDNLSADVRRVISLFDPLSQLAHAEILLRLPTAPVEVVALFRPLVSKVFEGTLDVTSNGSGPRFSVAGLDHVDALDLPDGYRAAAAWLADICAIWAAKNPESAKRGDPAEICGIVMIDEIDLHLHPSLQRSIVPRLRAAMPNVQWIVTTHSPLVLSNFDSNEIIALDRTVEGNVRKLDRQILGFTSDQIYEWLMDTIPSGEAIEGLIENEANGEHAAAELLTVSPEVSPEQAKERVNRLKSALERLRP